MGKPEGYVPGQAELDYVEALAEPLPPALAALEEQGLRDDAWIVDRAAGRVLATLAVGRRRILEFGTSYGYSTLWMALAMAPEGRITTIDPDVTRTAVARAHWRRAGVADERIEVIDAPALEVLADPARLPGPFDLVFIDAAKQEYPAYLEAALPRCAPGALIVADNVLWGGLVTGAPAGDAAIDPETTALHAFNAAALRHPGLVSTILPLADGLLLAAVRR
ncbi:MAG: hypothetical protein A2X23_00075 [Chloroflexi bacterium GWC2_73_18]|nr:MAG: hypothetical protein A2X23_00075 [Chloroflexi bacterium GWC2_73_18]